MGISVKFPVRKESFFVNQTTPARSFGRFALSSILSAGVDLAAFEVFCRILENFIASDPAILAATCLARGLSGLINYLINYFLVFHSESSHGKSMGLYALITVGKTLLSGLLVARLTLFLPALPRVGLKAGVDTLLFFVNYILQKAFVY